MPATADYLAEHPFADPDQVNPPEAPEYVYRPDINTLTGPGSLAAVDTDTLGAGSRIDILVGDLLQVYVLQAGLPTGSDLEVVPDDFNNPNNLVYWLLVDSGGTDLGSLTISFSDISGTISEDQLPPGSVGTLDSIGQDALYFFDDSANTPLLINSDDAVAFLAIDFADLSGTISADQVPPGTILSLDSIGEDALYFYDDSTATPMLISASTAATFLNLDFSNIGGTLSEDQFPPGLIVTLDSIDENALYFFDNTLFAPRLINAADTLTFLGITPGGGVPTGTGFYHVTSGVMDTAAVAETGTGSVVLATSPVVTDGHFKQLDNTTKSVVFGSRFTDTSPTGFMLRFMDAAQLGTVFSVTVNGAIVTNLGADGQTGLIIKRFTDTAPTGNFVDYRNAAGTSLWKTDITGSLVVGTIPEGRVTYTDPNANTIRMWDDTDNAMVNAIVGTNLTYTHSTHTLSATGGGSVTVATDTIWDTKGDLAVGTGADTAAKLIAGANDTMLMADSTQTTGLKWGTPTTVKTALGLVIGTNVQAWDTQLDSLATLSYSTNSLKVVRVNAGETAFELATVSGGAVPTGTGFYHVTSGAMDSASVGETGTGNVVRATGPTISGGLYFQTANNTNCIYGHRFTDTSPTGSFLAFANSTDLTAIWNVDVNGQTTINLDANALTGITVKRKTNTAPTGNFLEFQGATGGPLFRVDITGLMTLGSVGEARIVYTDPNINSIRMWDDTDNAITNAIIGSGLTYTHSTHTLSASGSGGSVTNPANLTTNAIVLGGANGTTDVKTVAGIVTDGINAVTLGTAGTNRGSLILSNSASATTTTLRASTSASSAQVYEFFDSGGGTQVVASQTWVTGPGTTNRVTGTGLWFTSGGSLQTAAMAIPTMATDAIWDTKGDLAVGTGADTAAKLVAGANDTILMADSAQTTGLKWGTPSTVRTALGLVIGTNVQAWDTDLDAWALRTPPSGTVLGTTDTQTLTNKRINPRVSTSSTGNTTPTPNADTDDVYVATGMTVNMTFGAPTGTPVDGQQLTLRILGTAARTLAFNAIYRFSSDLIAPTTTITTKTLYMGFLYNAIDSKWDNVAQLNNF